MKCIQYYSCYHHRRLYRIHSPRWKGRPPGPHGVHMQWRCLAANYNTNRHCIGYNYVVLVRCHSRIRSVTTAGQYDVLEMFKTIADVLRIEAYSNCIAEHRVSSCWFVSACSTVVMGNQYGRSEMRHGRDGITQL